MMPFSNGFLLSLSLCLDIGIANIAMITLAMQRGYFQGFWLGIGTCIGDLFYALLALSGLAMLLQFTPVRWVLWLGGSAMLLWFAVKMAMAAWQPTAPIAFEKAAPPRPLRQEFSRGVLLAISSPSAILWFATVGGALISRIGQQSTGTSVAFLSGFFIAGVIWTGVLCLVGHLGGRTLGQRLLKYCAIASAIIFSYFAIIVIVSGYREFMLR
ncbi:MULTISPECIES: LysE family translocator [Pantoea]|uniref:LysE family translocator n=1 Tax=Pantoea TaxID=53335 RepID=UPI001F449E0D|nr:MULTISPECIES: LysE family transporter [Pantoea]UIL50706.1 LysE family translocator [Pantoea agglomerans]